MSYYYINKAQQERLLASLNAIKYLASSMQSELELSEASEFDPSVFNDQIANIINESAFMQEFVTHNFLAAEPATGETVGDE